MVFFFPLNKLVSFFIQSIEEGSHSNFLKDEACPRFCNSFDKFPSKEPNDNSNSLEALDFAKI